MGVVSSGINLFNDLSSDGDDGGASQARSQAAQSRYRAYMARQKQRQMNQQAAITRQQANSQARRQRSRDSRRLASMRANMGGRGTQFGGSALSAYGNEARNADLNARNVRHQGHMRAWDQSNQARRYGQEAAMYDDQANRSDAEARQRMRKSERRRGRSLLTQATDFAGSLLGL